MSAPIYIIMGVSGTGKTTIGRGLSQASGLPFFDADDYHPAENVAKMASGQALNDEDRQPWLERLADLLAAQEQAQGAILACSALKERYRTTLASGLSTTPNWVFLAGSFELIYQRMQARAHFMPPELLQSQFDALEVPTYGLRISIQELPATIISSILQSKTH